MWWKEKNGMLIKIIKLLFVTRIFLSANPFELPLTGHFHLTAAMDFRDCGDWMDGWLSSTYAPLNLHW